ncbi:ATPase [Colletotrichum chrysophilum]|uniref:ATPase n=1 Tax=Colletotrichum chrysophilum TaxID=1836956 RepID=A0AAD9A687_9PEZI|nr:ATPase [Colletotrichum chrysophilum]
MATEMQHFSSDTISTLERRYIALLELRIKDLESRVGETDEEEATSDLVPLAGKSMDSQPGTSERDIELKENKTTSAETHPHNGPQTPRCLFVQRPLEPINGSAECALERSELVKLGLESIETGSESQGSPEQLKYARIVEEDGRYFETEISVQAPELKALLSVALEAYPNLHLPPPDSPSSWDKTKDPVVFVSPCEPLIHNWDRLNALAIEDSLRTEEMKVRIQKLGPRTDVTMAGSEEQKARALEYLGKASNLENARAQLKLMLKLVKTIPELGKYFQSVEAQNNTGSIQFEHLWTIFPPGEIVFSTLFMNEPQLFIVKDSNDTRDIDERPGKDTSDVSWSMVAWAYDWDGACFKRVPVQFRFEQYTGSKVISTLHCHPFKFHKPEDASRSDEASREAMEEALLERGKRFAELCVKQQGSQMFDYDGFVVSHGTGFQNQADDSGDILWRMIFGRSSQRSKERRAPKKRRIQGRVMVDFEAYLQYSPWSGTYAPMGSADFPRRDNECRCPACVTNAALRDSQKMAYDGVKTQIHFEDLQFKICPPRVLGYHLDSRTWLELNVGKQKTSSSEATEEWESYLKDIKELRSSEAFEKLQLLPTQKSLIKDLVRCHSSGANSKPLMTDIIKGKGKGLVILLHGPPGVGKTLTAESVAQLAGKPLFSVGVSDIGLKPAEVEQNLEALFELAANWRAVLLFDEADVFLESRSSHTSDLNRNALVSVLLRVLEYYEGILILTTNRITQFDIAVQSRVNLGIKYDDLQRDQKQEIFDNFIGQLKPDQVKDKEMIRRWFKDEEEARDWTEGLNGRQIRNILFSAASLAQQDGGELDLKHISRMAKSTWRFHDSIKTVVDEARRRAEAGRK